MDRNRKIYQTYHLARYEDSCVNRYMLDFVREEPLLIRVEDRPYSVVMRAPGDEIAHAAGFCLSEELLPVNWLRSEATDLFDQYHELLTEQANQYFDSVLKE